MNIEEIKELNLWPNNKKTTTNKGLDELENSGYNLFYIGKNADLYTTSGKEAKILLVRSDRTSVFDIPLNLEIEGKGIIQTSISNFGAKFANNFGIKTAILDEKVDSSLKVYPRCQLMELCKPLEATINGELVQFELIFRNYLTGSLFQALQDNLDPYGLNLPKDLKEWHKFDNAIFTPTTKGLKDEPLKSADVREVFPEIIEKLENLFKSFTKFAEERGIIVVDTKFEVFVEEDGTWVLGDEILTPESSRFIPKEEFLKANFVSMDKQILRDFGKKENWKEQAKSLKASEKLEVKVPQEIKDKILNGYKTILERLSK
ncbi:Phosphoribosylaminoimidazole-succinocarboxamide synthase [Aliarcobacter thereius]|uniref:phosphoribosylaminoimidazolesuccinocarboxamide synthase n=1 Tax=Aliarcobacter thereius LMG 24486 TaxID=1032240 RepID=A0A1C7WNQ4_9BACT|nr:phosphoribosylaminoimidazolesuccinocarboxamide synthase [Aliarcobacter thereius]OCL87559.1 Phosphoribosylaminoimidazole-succinocarboxamide synthase [Aliarcobacter thereius]OCL95208.1 Phosphoribosylaminoimidazole-succinocarboxamide synthase [Aliarcobacter thereius LMG 24486]QBF16802.1 phosphoribosylaminoimidazole-succinocarboxamide synthase [Aliarcobacter thereius LMG 24486]TLS94169.1 phosphoribosylaminoimidazolesuccinocarboxamide synthase [Aliarcobacter thereius]TLT08679.1 phosphoribosylami